MVSATWLCCLAAGLPPIRAVKLTFSRAVSNIDAVISVLRGTRLEQEDVIAQVLVPPAGRVRVEALAALGIAPIELSQAVLPPASLYSPVVTTVSTMLVIDNVEILTAPFPGYRIEVVNLAPSAVVSFQVRGFHASGLSDMSAIKAEREGRPIVPASGAYSFDLLLKSAGSAEAQIVAPEPLDRIAIDAILWDDGTKAGAERVFDELRVLPAEVGQRVQIMRRSVFTGVDGTAPPRSHMLR
jgi:hypothetical protein